MEKIRETLVWPNKAWVVMGYCNVVNDMNVCNSAWLVFGRFEVR